MKGLLLTLSGVMLITLLSTPTLGAGWLWDIGNGIGFVAFAGLLYLIVSSGPVVHVQAHQLFGFAVLGVATAHAFWFPLFDAAVLEYIKPGAPAYMWMGVLGFALLAALILIGLPEYRLRLHGRYATFKYWHRGLAIASIIAGAYHVAASGFYLNTAYQVVLFALLAVAVLLGGRLIGRGSATVNRVTAKYLAVGAVCVAVFAGVRNISL